MTRSKKHQRQKVVDRTTVAALMGDLPNDNREGIVATLAREQAGGDRIQERISNRNRPMRPTEARRQKRRLSLAFSPENKDAVQRLRDLATRWGMFANNGTPNVSAVAEHLLLPQIEAAEQGKIEPPDQPMSTSSKRSENVWF